MLHLNVTSNKSTPQRKYAPSIAQNRCHGPIKQFETRHSKTLPLNMNKFANMVKGNEARTFEQEHAYECT